MPDVYLGPTIIEAILLPRIRWMGGGAPDLPVDYSKKIEKARTLSGTQRFNVKATHPRRWQFSWGALRNYELDELKALNEYNRTLQLQNGWEGAAWKTVFMTSFEYAPNLKTNLCGGIVAGTFYGTPFYGGAYYCGIYSDMPLYSVAITLEEAA